MGPACGLVGPGMYPASSGDPGECRDKEAADETQTTESRVRLYLSKHGHQSSVPVGGNNGLTHKNLLIIL